MTIPLDPYVAPYKPLPQVTPFTYRDGLTMLKKLDGMVKYINKDLVPFVNENYEKLGDEFETQVNALIQAVNAAIDLVINDSVDVQDPIVAQLIEDVDSLTNDALELWLNIDSRINTEITSPTSATRQTLNSQFVNSDELVFNVKDYGAKGDGTTDDTNAINAAQTAANGRTLYFPNGTYVFNNTITNQVVIGENRQRTILHYVGTVAAIGVATPVAQSYHKRIENLTIKGNSFGYGIDIDAHAAGMFSRLLVVNFARAVYIHSSIYATTNAQSLYNVFFDCTFQTINGHAVVIENVSHENRFIACRVNGATRGFNIVSGGRNTIDNCSLEEISDRGIFISNNSGTEINKSNTIINSRFENITNEAIVISVGIESTQVICNRIIGTGTRYLDNGTGTFLIHDSGVVAPARYTTALRPTMPAQIIGGMIWDTTLGKPVWWNGTAWKDATGTTV